MFDDVSLIEFCEHLDYYVGVYDAQMLVVLADGEETLVRSSPDEVSIEYSETYRSYMIDGCETSDGSDASLRIEHAYGDPDEIDNVTATVEDGFGEETHIALRWGLYTTSEGWTDV